MPNFLKNFKIFWPRFRTHVAAEGRYFWLAFNNKKYTPMSTGRNGTDKRKSRDGTGLEIWTIHWTGLANGVHGTGRDHKTSPVPTSNLKGVD